MIQFPFLNFAKRIGLAKKVTIIPFNKTHNNYEKRHITDFKGDRRDPEYPEGLTYPFYTHKHAHGNCTELVWVCEDCGYTSFFEYRNDMICADGIYYCERCHCSQCLTPFYNGHKAIQCVECKQTDKLRSWDGKICPKCGGNIVQFNAAQLKRKYYNYNYFYADKNVTIFDSIEEKGLPDNFSDE